MALVIHTIGYEKSQPEDFLRRLQEHRIGRVVDVRQLPLSRKRGFSKTPLRKMLQEAGIDYFHARELGVPKPLRQQRKGGCSWADYARQYAVVLDAHPAEIDALITMAATHSICLLCFERDPLQCHRSLVVDRMQKVAEKAALKVDHIRY